MSTRLVVPVLAILLAAPLFGCGDDPEANQNQGEDPYERPDGARDLISDELLDDFVAAGLDVHGGLNAPSIAGTYLYEDSNVAYTDSDLYPSNAGHCFIEETYEATATDEQFLVSSQGVSGCPHTSEAASQFISGDEGCFTLYGEVSGVFDGCDFEARELLSACLDSESGDLLDPQRAGVILDLSGETCQSIIDAGRIPDVGELYILVQQDGRARLLD